MLNYGREGMNFSFTIVIIRDKFICIILSRLPIGIVEFITSIKR